jgi:hypothetical protein
MSSLLVYELVNLRRRCVDYAPAGLVLLQLATIAPYFLLRNPEEFLLLSPGGCFVYNISVPARHPSLLYPPAAPPNAVVYKEASLNVPTPPGSISSAAGLLALALVTSVLSAALIWRELQARGMIADKNVSRVTEGASNSPARLVFYTVRSVSLLGIALNLSLVAIHLMRSVALFVYAAPLPCRSLPPRPRGIQARSRRQSRHVNSLCVRMHASQVRRPAF